MRSLIGVRTSLGIVPFAARPAGDADRPLIFGIRGAFPPPDQLVELSSFFPEADVAIALLPGLNFSWNNELSVEVFAEAIREAALTLYQDRKFIVVGASIGGVVALRLRDIADVIALDPPLSTGKAWPLAQWFAEQSLTEVQRVWAWEVLGLSENPQDRDYSSMLTCLHQPATIIAGGIRLDSERALSAMPSLLDESDLRRIGMYSEIRLKIADRAGHDVLREDPSSVVCEIRKIWSDKGLLHWQSV